MGDSEKPCGSYSVSFCKFAIGFIALSTYLVMHMTDIISRHIAVAFNLPTHNIGIYFDKLYCLRTLGLVLGGFIENGIFQAAGGDKDLKSSIKVRRYVGVCSFGLVLVVRSVYLFILYSSSQLSYHVYLILILEGFALALHDNSLMALGSEFISVISPMYNLGRIFISCCQMILDRLWYNRPLLMIKMQAWICVIFTSGSVGLWYYYNFQIKEHHLDKNIKKQQEQESQVQEQHVEQQQQESQVQEQHVEEQQQSACGEICKVCADQIGNDGIGAALSPLLLYWSSTMFRDFTFPATLPYGLLARDKCHIINVMIPFFNNLGPALFFVLDNFTEHFSCWTWPYHLFWLLFIPMPVIFIFALRAMVTPSRSARRIINSRARVTCMTFVLMTSFGFNEPLSYIGLAKYAFRQNPNGFTLMGYHITSALFCRALFSKIAVGFSDTRISLGYHLPKFRPNHRMSRKNLYMYLFRQTFRRAWKDAQGDFRLDIKKYL